MFRVEVVRSGGWWAIEYADDHRLHSQARRLDQVPAVAANALSMIAGREVSPDEVKMSVNVDDLLGPVVSEAVKARRDVEHARERAAAATREAVSRALDAGLPLRDVGRLLGVTHQRVSAIAREIRRAA